MYPRASASSVRRPGDRQRGGQEQDRARHVVPEGGRGVDVVMVDVTSDPPGVWVVGQAEAVDPPPAARRLDAAKPGAPADVPVVVFAAPQVDHLESAPDGRLTPAPKVG